MERLKVGILGFGKMGRVYGRWFSENPHCEVAAVYNRSEAKREAVESALPGAAFYTDWRALIALEEIDIIGLCTATHEKHPQIKAALFNNKHVICEKPICLDLDEFYDIKQADGVSGGKFLVASELRLHPVIQAVGALLPEIGDIFHIAFDYSMLRDEIKWKHRLESGGGIMRELGQHLLDVANIWLGEPKNVYGINMIINPRREVEDFSETAIRYASGAAVRLTCHYFEHTTNTYNGKIYGSKGQIDFRLSSYDTNAHWIRLYNGEDVKEIPVAVPSFIDEVYPGHMDSFKKEIDGFVGAILQGAPADNSLEEEERTMQAICASYASNRFNKTVALPFAHFSKDALTQCFTRFGKGAAQL